MEKSKLLIVMDEKGIRTEISGRPEDVMFLAETALTESRKALEKIEPISHEDAVKLMDEVIESYRTEAIHGPEVAAIRAFVELLKHF